MLARGAEILILDEPTASLSVDDAKTLGQIMRGFAADRGSVFYISHKLNEVKEIADRITVMRRGKIVGGHTSSAVSVEQLAAEMVGELIQADRPSKYERGKRLPTSSSPSLSARARKFTLTDAPTICALCAEFR